MEVQARRLDSPLDSVLTLFDAAGKKLDENDDRGPPLAEAEPVNKMPYPDQACNIDPLDALATHVADSRLVHTFAKAGDYVVRIRDVHEQGGEEYAYRLKIAPARPDYVLRINTDSARLVQGDSAVLAVSVLRKDGFDGEIRLAVQDLPPGLLGQRGGDPGRGRDETQLTITARRMPRRGCTFRRRGHRHGGRPAAGAEGRARRDGGSGLLHQALGADQGLRAGGERTGLLHAVGGPSAQAGAGGEAGRRGPGRREGGAQGGRQVSREAGGRAACPARAAASQFAAAAARA